MAENTSERGRVYFDAGSDLYSSAKVLAAHQQMSLAALAREALAQIVERSTLIADEDEAGVTKSDSLPVRKRKFILAVERRYKLNIAARICKLELKDVMKWAEKDPVFDEGIALAQQLFADRLEMKLVCQLRRVKSQGKDRFLVWQSFLNAHSPHHGRIKADQVAREYRGFIDEAYKVLAKDLTVSQAKKTIDKIKVMAERRMAKLGD